MAHYQKHIFICNNQKAASKKCCANSGADDVFAYFKEKLLENKLHGVGKFRLTKSGCLGRCSSGPCLVIYPEQCWYSYKSFADIDKIIAAHLIGGEQVTELLIA